MGKNDSTCFGCLFWGRQRESSSPRTRSTRRPISALRSASRPTSTNKVRGHAKTAPEAPPPQWRSQVGVSDDSSTSSADGATDRSKDAGVKSYGLSATAFPSDSPTTLERPDPLVASGPSLIAAGEGCSSPQPPASPAKAAYGDALAGAASSTCSPPRGREEAARPDAAARLTELQQHYRLRSAARNRGPAQAQPHAPDRLRTVPSDSTECASFSYNASAHAGQQDPVTRLGQLPPLPASLGGAGPSDGGGGTRRWRPAADPPRPSSPDNKVLPFMLCTVLQSGSDSMTAAIPGSLPSVTQLGRGSGAESAEGRTHATAAAGACRGQGPGSPQAFAASNGRVAVRSSSPGILSQAHSGLFAQPLQGPQLRLSHQCLGAAETHGSAGRSPVLGLDLPPQVLDGADGFSFTMLPWKPGTRPSPLGAEASRDSAAASPRGEDRRPEAGVPHHTVHGPAGYSSAAASPVALQLAKSLAARRQHQEQQRHPGKPPFGTAMVPERSAGKGAGAGGAGFEPLMGEVPGAAGEPGLEQGGAWRRVTSSGSGRGGAVESGCVPGEGAAEVRQGMGMGRTDAGSAPLPMFERRTTLRRPASLKAATDEQGQATLPRQWEQQQQHQAHPPQQRPQPGLPAVGDDEAGGEDGGDGDGQQGPPHRQQPRQPQQRKQDPPEATQFAVAVAWTPPATEQPPGMERRAAPSGAASAVGDNGTARPLHSVDQRRAAVKANEQMLASLLSGKGGFGFATVKADGCGGGGGGGGGGGSCGDSCGGGAAEELERFDRVQDAVARLEDILGSAPPAPSRSLNARAGSREDAATDFSGSAPAAANPAMAVRPW